MGSGAASKFSYELPKSPSTTNDRSRDEDDVLEEVDEDVELDNFLLFRTASLCVAIKEGVLT